METREDVAPPVTEETMIEPEVIRRVRRLHELGWGSKKISREVGIARNTVRRYLRGATPLAQVRPARRALDDAQRSAACELLRGAAEGNAVVVRQMLAESGHAASVRTVQRVVAADRRELRARDIASVRFETAPGAQMQVDFGEKLVKIGAELVRVYLLAAVLSHSRRIFVKAFLAQRGDEWREGIALAFRHFGGVPLTVLGDNAKPLVLRRDSETGAATFHPAYLAFCRDFDVEPRACGPYRARTKGKVESGVKFAKRNGIAGREFESFASFEAHLSEWCAIVDQRVHGTTHERPIDRFERDERAALRALPMHPIAVRVRRLVRRVSNDAFVDIDTVRYSVPFKLVRERVEVAVFEHRVEIFSSASRVAIHQRSHEPHSRVVAREHFDGIFRRQTIESPARATFARSLDVYASALVHA